MFFMYYEEHSLFIIISSNSFISGNLKTRPIDTSETSLLLYFSVSKGVKQGCDAFIQESKIKF